MKDIVFTILEIKILYSSMVYIQYWQQHSKLPQHHPQSPPTTPINHLSGKDITPSLHSLLLRALCHLRWTLQPTNLFCVG